MTTLDDPQHRNHHHPDADRITVREELDDETDIFAVRMPVATTGEVRNQGDDPLTRDELAGMSQQINEGSVGVFLDHGRDLDIAGSRYGATGKLGVWADAAVEQREDGLDELVAEARLMDPETLPAAAGSLREALAAIKEQVQRDIPISSSIGWREDDDAPGGNDLMEASIVGIPADPRTTADAPVEVARAALTHRDDVDGEELVAQFRAVVMGPDASNRDMSENTESGEEPDPDDEQDSTDAEQFRAEMLEMQRTQTETLTSLAEAIRADDEDGDEDDDDDEDDGEMEADADAPADEQDTADEDAERTLQVGCEELTAEDVRDLRDELEGLRDSDDVKQRETGPDETQDTDESPAETSSTKYNKYGMKPTQ